MWTASRRSSLLCGGMPSTASSTLPRTSTPLEFVELRGRQTVAHEHHLGLAARGRGTIEEEVVLAVDELLPAPARLSWRCGCFCRRAAAGRVDGEPNRLHEAVERKGEAVQVRAVVAGRLEPRLLEGLGDQPRCFIPAGGAGPPAVEPVGRQRLDPGVGAPGLELPCPALAGGWQGREQRDKQHPVRPCFHVSPSTASDRQTRGLPESAERRPARRCRGRRPPRP